MKCGTVWDMEETSSTKPVACAFCGESVRYTDRDPIGIGVVEHWRPEEEGIDWMIYAHRACLLSLLTEDVRDGVDW